jgi:hypothetical protein
MYRRVLKTEPYATIIPDRRPAVKCHAHIGLAKIAVGYVMRRGIARGGEIYRRGDDGWELLYRVEAGTPTAQLPWRESQCSSES